jgi:hypothetical protein
MPLIVVVLTEFPPMLDARYERCPGVARCDEYGGVWEVLQKQIQLVEVMRVMKEDPCREEVVR